ncbi:2-oxoglutarate and iron-dependent oxygenase domain-containing protein [Micromonospora sp. WMMD956]|uniref:isopenicillin N synthase family dioxygenase n=1 Tax=Micromonospora TaxID=1873 RepID=UPI002417FC0E|nr:2-oxoglutarate and iron-dependent oxygenase domain-containing protein [Micromonospora sp. WMMD956]MDG4819150.1 2-oxoglutarate and iron-dependent oxygenase domain-containing protein [Micromonospora sp. WMMD956]
MTTAIPTLDLTRWRSADPDERARTSAELDAALRQTGMFLLAGHGVPADLTARMRAVGHAFMRLAPEQKRRYAVSRPYDNGWRGLGALQASAVDGMVSAPDLHEAYHMGPQHRTGDARFDWLYYPDNKWPTELPELREVATEYTGHLNRLALDVLEVLAVTLGVPADHFTSRSQRATWTQNVNWYPPLSAVGRLEEGQMRVGPHSDFGTITFLDRQQGVGGLEAWNAEDGWFKPPFVPGTLVVNLGDMMNLWTDGRWRALRHRVLAPPASDPDEELVSLVFFFEADPDAEVRPLAPPAGGGAGMAPVVAGESILEKVGVTLTLAD